MRIRRIAMRMASVAVLALPLAAQSVRDCRTVFIGAMPEGLERHAAARLARLGLTVSREKSEADCELIFSRSTPVTGARPGTDPAPPPVIAADAQNLYEQVMEQARTASGGDDRRLRVAAFGLVHRTGARLVWSVSATYDAAKPPAPKTLAAQLLDRLRRELPRPRR